MAIDVTGQVESAAQAAWEEAAVISLERYGAQVDALHKQYGWPLGEAPLVPRDAAPQDYCAVVDSMNRCAEEAFLRLLYKALDKAGLLRVVDAHTTGRAWLDEHERLVQEQWEARMHEQGEAAG